MVLVSYHGVSHTDRMRMSHENVKIHGLNALDESLYSIILPSDMLSTNLKDIQTMPHLLLVFKFDDT
jgi:hypothetical protein